jgi:transposase-like protein
MPIHTPKRRDSMSQKIIRYSEAFKLQVIADLESGSLPGVAAAQEKYGIAGNQTINNWLNRYGRYHLINRIIRVETTKDVDQVKALKKRIRELEKALATTQVDYVLNKAYYHIVCEQHGIEDPEEFKKKLDIKL